MYILFILFILFNLAFAALVGMVLLMLVHPALFERFARWRAESTGFDFDAIVKNPAKYRSALRWRAAIALPMLIPTWAFIALLLWITLLP